MKLSIAQALTYKKRVGEAILKASEDVKTYNSVEVFNEEGEANRDDVDVKKLVEHRDNLKHHMISLKLALWEASAKIRQDILVLAELKDDAVFWASVETKHGKFKDKYETTATEKNAVYKKTEVDTKIVQIKKEIDKKQQEIESFNHTNFVEVEDVGI